jgi:hypothetical protein
MYGVVDGVYFKNTNRSKELSERIFARNIPSAPIKGEVSFRPEQTKFTILGKDEGYRHEQCGPNVAYANYEPSKIFHPGNNGAPWYGYAANINNESTLRNQFFALQKAGQAAWVPSTNSELYNAKVVSKSVENPHPHLDKRAEFEPFQPNTCGIAKQLFHNHTHQQIKDLSL